MRQANRFISINSSNLLISEQRRAALRFCTKRDTRKASDVPRKPKGFYLPGIDSVLIGQSPSRRDKDIRLFCFRSFFSASFRKIFVRIHPVVLPGFIPTDLLYHTFPDLSINRWLKIRIFLLSVSEIPDRRLKHPDIVIAGDIFVKPGAHALTVSHFSKDPSVR